MNFSKPALLRSKEKASTLMAATAYNFNEKRKPFLPGFFFSKGCLRSREKKPSHSTRKMHLIR